MNIYQNIGGETVVDLPAALRELRGSGAYTNEGVRRSALAELNTAALLDIASSLRVLAAEAEAAMPYGDEHGDDEVDNPETDETRDFLVVGDHVLANDRVAEVVKVGVSEGAPWADIRYPDNELDLHRVWASEVARVAAAIVERDGETIGDGETIATLTPAAVAVEVEEIDDDFDGDGHPEAASALDVLRANEAERKAAKKTTPKKGTKK